MILNKNRRYEVLQAAAHLFREKGYASATVRDIAQAVGMQSGSLFHHFKTKEDMLYAVMEEVILTTTGKMHMALEKVKDPAARIRVLIQSEVEAIHGETRDAMAVLVFDWRSLSAEKQAKILKLRDVYETLWLDILNEGKAAGLFTMDTFVLRRLLTGALAWTYTWYELQGPIDLAQLVDQALLLVIKKSDKR